MGRSTLIRVVVVDDNEAVRSSLVGLLEHYPHFEVLGEGKDGLEAIKIVRHSNPDVVLMDVRMPLMGGIEACRQIKEDNPHVKILMLTSYSDEEAVFASILAGASGYILKRGNTDSLIRDIEEVAKGNSLLDPVVTAGVFEKIKHGLRLNQVSNNSHSLWNELSTQEKKVILLIGEGKTNKEIAKELFLSEKTIRNYVSNILNKLSFSNRTQVAAYVASNGLSLEDK